VVLRKKEKKKGFRVSFGVRGLRRVVVEYEKQEKRKGIDFAHLARRTVSSSFHRAYL
jgi:hypothetical protein